VVVHDEAGDRRQQAAAFGRDAIERQPQGGGDMPPLRAGADAKAGLVQVLDRGRRPFDKLRSARARPRQSSQSGGRKLG
jgi:hypothetical protein